MTIIQEQHCVSFYFSIFRLFNIVYIHQKASLVAQMVKNPHAMWETWVQSLGWEDPLEEKGMATYSSILAWRVPMDRGAWWATVHRTAKSWIAHIHQSCIIYINHELKVDTSRIFLLLE